MVLTTLVGTSAFASISKAQGNSIQGLEIDPDIVLLAVGTISVLAAVLSSLQTFLRYATRAEGHRIAALRYETAVRRRYDRTASALATHWRTPRRARASAEVSPIATSTQRGRQRMDRYAKEVADDRRATRWVKLSAEFGLSTVPPDPSRRAEPVVIPDGVEPRCSSGR